MMIDCYYLLVDRLRLDMKEPLCVEMIRDPPMMMIGFAAPPTIFLVLEY